VVLAIGFYLDHFKKHVDDDDDDDDEYTVVTLINVAQYK